MARFTIPRRMVLRGVGGATLALPALECMTGGRKALAGGGIKRFLQSCTETSISSCYDVNSYPNKEMDFVTPKKTGLDWEITPGLQSIQDNGVKAEMGLLSGLRIPVSSLPDRSPHNVPGGINLGVFHTGTTATQCAGMANFAGDEHTEPDNPRGPTCDQLMVPVLSSPDQFMKSLALQTTPGTSQGAPALLSWGAPDANSRLDDWGRPLARAKSMVIDPDTAYRQLFGQAAPISGAAGKAAGEALWRSRRSVIDVVGQRFQMLLKRCGQQDKLILTRYADHIRDLEKQIDQLKSMPTTDIFAPPPHISAEVAPYPHSADGMDLYDKNAGYCGEKQRGPLLAQIVHAAFLTDRTRVVSWHVMSGGLNYYPLFGAETMAHMATHDPPQPKRIAQGISWAIGNLAYLVKLMSAPEALDPDGSRMIDNSALCMYFEGGYGLGTDHNMQKYAAGFRDPHSVENMLLITAGGKNLGLHLNQHVAFGNTRHPAEGILTMMRALGHTGQLNQIADTIPEMTRAAG